MLYALVTIRMVYVMRWDSALIPISHICGHACMAAWPSLLHWCGSRRPLAEAVQRLAVRGFPVFPRKMLRVLATLRVAMVVAIASFWDAVVPPLVVTKAIAALPGAGIKNFAVLVNIIDGVGTHPPPALGERVWFTDDRLPALIAKHHC